MIQRKHLLIAPVAILILMVMYVMIYQNLTRGSTDFYPRWKGAQLFWQEGLSPYNVRVGEESQKAIYGRLAEPDQDQVLFAYPFYTIFHVGPLALLNFKTAAAIYMQLLILGTLLSMALTVHSVHWLPSPTMLALLALWSWVSYFAVRGFFLGQPGLAVAVFHIAAVWAIVKTRDNLAGILLGLSTIKPQTNILILPILLIWAWRYRRYGVITGFSGMFGLFLGLSFLLEPTWLQDWLQQIRAYENYTETIPAAQVVARFLFPAGIETVAYWGLSLLLMLPVLIYWKKNLTEKNNSAFQWGYYLTMTVTLLITPRVATTYYLEVYPVLYLTAFILVKQRQTLLVWFSGLLMLIGFWALHITTVPSVAEHGAGLEAPIVYVVFPVMILALLFIYRPQWQRI